MVKFFGLRPPQLIKIDIEGAEEYAIQGMEETLKTYHPLLLLEIHGQDAAKSTLPFLNNIGYHFQELNGKLHKSADSFLADFPDIVCQIICISNS